MKQNEYGLHDYVLHSFDNYKEILSSGFFWTWSSVLLKLISKFNPLMLVKYRFEAFKMTTNLYQRGLGWWVFSSNDSLQFGIPQNQLLCCWQQVFFFKRKILQKILSPKSFFFSTRLNKVCQETQSIGMLSPHSDFSFDKWNCRSRLREILIVKKPVGKNFIL